MDLKLGLRAALVCALLLSTSAVAEENQHYIMAMGAPGTKPYVVGVSLQSLVNLKLMPKSQFGLDTLIYDDYTESVRALGEGRSQFAIADSVTADAAANGKGLFQAAGPNRDLKAVAVLWQEVDHVLIASDRALSGTITDVLTLSGDTIATDPANREATRELLTTFGMQTGSEEALPVFDGPGQLNAFDNGAVAALAITRPMSSTGMAQIVDALRDRAQLLEFTGRQLTHIGKGWHRHQIVAGTYPGLDHDINTIARAVLLLANAAVADDVVYQIARTMFENLPFLAAMDKTAALITLNDALEGMTLSLHPGAARFYQEVGLLPPGSTDPADALSLLATEPGGTATTNLSETPSRSNDRPTPIAGNIPSGTAGVTPSFDFLPPLPSFVLDDAMLNRSRAEIHNGAEVLKIDRPDDLDRPGTEIVNVYFGLGDTQPNTNGLTETRSAGLRILQLYQSSNLVPEVYVEGHADRTGDWKINFEIAHRRAVSTKEILVSEGVPDDWIHISDHSEQKLAVATADGVGNWRNRRVEVTIIPRDGAAQ